jgi:hypothetical protein
VDNVENLSTGFVDNFWDVRKNPQKVEKISGGCENSVKTL